MADAGANQFTFHIEAVGMDTAEAARIAAAAREAGMMAGIALAPETPADAVFPLVDSGAVDTVLLLSVRPGACGRVRQQVRCCVGLQGGTEGRQLFKPAALSNPLSSAAAAAAGFGGQKFMPEVLPKVRALRARYPEIQIEVDGGVNLENAGTIAAAGANALVAGTTVFAGPAPPEIIIPQLVALIADGLASQSA